jgi:CHAT domain-containing protein
MDDAATRGLMARFYASLWEKRRPVLEALREAQLSVLDDPEYGDGGGPNEWAAWVLNGDRGRHPRPAGSAKIEARP